VAQAAGVAALGDVEHVARTRALVREQRPILEAGLKKLGATVAPSQGNFLLADFPGRNGQALFQALLRDGVVVRPVGGYGFPSALRFTVGIPAENARALEALARVLASVPPAVPAP
jgi:histidinol-phosphate aminotransferase